MICLILLVTACTRPAAATPSAPTTADASVRHAATDVSVFHPPHVIDNVRRNVREHARTSELRDAAVQRAQPWVDLTDEELWSLMFTPELPRAWQVLSHGNCPACDEPVPMYAWEVDAMREPWKMHCPHCEQRFPTNDFEAYHRSGLDEHGLFREALADRTLLYNSDHPDPDDPLHLFGVDDGHGFEHEGERWLFVGGYLVWGQWKQRVVAGVEALSRAYVLTGDPIYARKAGILLDRIADLYPAFSFKAQGYIYEQLGLSEGYVSVWHDACAETQSLVLAYDAIRPGLAVDDQFVAFLRDKAEKFNLDQPKPDWPAIRDNIERGLLRDPLAKPAKVHSNFPRQHILLSILRAVLAGPAGWDDLLDETQAWMEQATAVDGVTGEKGLPAYSSYAVHNMSYLMAILDRADDQALVALLKRSPGLTRTFRFFIDTWVMEQFYPQIGDGGWMRPPAERQALPYLGIDLESTAGPELMWRWYEVTGDVDYARILYKALPNPSVSLHRNVYARDPDGIERALAEVINEHGESLEQTSVNLEQWGLAMLRSGEGDARRTVWMHYDTGGGHSHADALTLGLYAFNEDLMADFGYPPVHYGGGWDSPQLKWYQSTASHNTILVNRTNQVQPHVRHTGTTSLWASGVGLQAMRASAVDALPTPVSLDHAEGDRIGFYSYTGGAFTSVRIETHDPETGEWREVFTDDFDRETIGDNWHVIEGEWKIEDGQLVGHGTIINTHSFPGAQRLSYRARTDADEPCDLSAFLRSDARGFHAGVFFGFGSDMNRRSRITAQLHTVAEAGTIIERGRTHHVVCEIKGNVAQHKVDGELIQQYESTSADSTAPRYERTAVMVDIDERSFYVLDVARVTSSQKDGNEHVRMMHSHISELATEGLNLVSTSESYDPMMRNYFVDTEPEIGWRAVFTTPDTQGEPVHLAWTDLTHDAEALTAEGWVHIGHYNEHAFTWLPRIMTRRVTADAALTSTFAGIIETYRDAPTVRQSRRLPLYDEQGSALGDTHVAIEVRLADGRHDLLIAVDPEASPAGSAVVQPDWGVTFAGDLAVIRRGDGNRVQHVSVCRGQALTLPGLRLELADKPALIEIGWNMDGVPALLTGAHASVTALHVDGEAVQVRD
ncbi:heparinase II/III family protein [Phycisphaerales bacterium AB-hyl4]|uniref:Heparinase II/III family protein n=1 Tax=Natronomicrosphaera hydrolytica TaxID=3242702 RepID=A0ABV4U5V2_9BACT